jgi:hypothetical protein
MKRLFCVMLGILCLLGGCATGDDGEEEEQPSGGEETSGPKKVTVTGKEYSFDLPSTITGGFVDLEFKNEGKLTHEAAFIKVTSDVPEEQFIKDLKAASGEEGGPIANYLKPYAGPAEPKAGETQTVKQALPGGDYYVVCTLTDLDSVEGGEEAEPTGPPLPQHFELGMLKKVTVDGPEEVELPDSDVVVAAKEYSFDITGLKAGKNEILFRNDGPKEIHMAAALEFPEGVDEAAAAKAIEAFTASEGPPPAGTPEPEDAGFAGVFDVGGGSVFELDAKSGRVYAFVCFIQDRAGGPPHATKGMSKLVKVA